jgi:DNA-binding winged helix-turn-helix (wHTH) protein/tetratricopeptide (TPR) repeat protein
MDVSRSALVLGDRCIGLTAHEFKLLAYFVAHPGRALPRDELLREVWGLRGRIQTRAIDMNVARLRRKLAEALETEDGPLRTLFGTGYRFDPPVATGESMGASGEFAPPDEAATAFFGREAECAALDGLLSGSARLVTLLGAGGLGKTRLVREWLRRSPRRRVLWVDVGAAPDLDAVTAAVAGALGLASPAASVEEVGAVLSRRPDVLLVVDEFERVAGLASPALRLWLRAAPTLRICVTSRIATGLPEERLLEIGPLATADAVRVLRDRAPEAQASPGLLALADGLGGIPLALELAAARLDVLTPRQLLGRMDRALELLVRPTSEGVDGRHDAFVRVLASSWQLLSAAEQAVAAQMAVFTADVPLETIEAVVRPPPDETRRVADVVAALRARSFLTARTEGETRLLGTYALVRLFLAERLIASGLYEATRHRAVEHFLSVGADALEHWWRAGEDDALFCLESIAPHLLGLATTAPEPHVRARAFVALEPVFAQGGGSTDRWRRPMGALLESGTLPAELQNALALAMGWLAFAAGEPAPVAVPTSTEGLDPRSRARWRFLEARYEHIGGHVAAASTGYEAALAWARASGDAAIEADIRIAQAILLVLPHHLDEADHICREARRLDVGPRFRALVEARQGNIAVARGDLDTAIARFRRALQLLGDGPHPLARLTIETYLGNVCRDLRDAEATVARWEVRLSAMRDLCHPAALCGALSQYGRSLLVLDRADEAAPLFAESLGLGRSLGFRGATAEALVNLGHLAIAQGDTAGAARWFEQATTTFESWLPALAAQTRFLWTFVRALEGAAVEWPSLPPEPGDLGPIAAVMRRFAEGERAAALRALGATPPAAGWRFHFWRRWLPRLRTP